MIKKCIFLVFLTCFIWGCSNEPSKDSTSPAKISKEQTQKEWKEFAGEDTIMKSLEEAKKHPKKTPSNQF